MKYLLLPLLTVLLLTGCVSTNPGDPDRPRLVNPEEINFAWVVYDALREQDPEVRLVRLTELRAEADEKGFILTVAWIDDKIQETEDEIEEANKPPPPPEPTPVEEYDNGNPDFNAICPDPWFSNTFLWKPIAETTHKLIVLIEAKYRADFTKTELGTNEAGVWNRWETGEQRRTNKRCINGGRPHMQHGLPGPAYGRAMWYRVYLKNGTVFEYFIPDPAQRYEFRGGGNQILMSTLADEDGIIRISLQGWEATEDPGEDIDL